MPKSVSSIFDGITAEPETTTAPPHHSDPDPVNTGDLDGPAPSGDAPHSPEKPQARPRKKAAIETPEVEQTRKASAILPMSVYRALHLELYARNAEILEAGDGRVLSVSSLMAELIEDGLARASRKRKGGAA